MSLKVAFNYLLESLHEVKSIKGMRVLDEGAVLVSLLRLGFEENIMIYLLAGELSLEFIKKSVNANTRAEVHTLFIVSRDLVPDEGQVCRPEGSLRLLLDLYAEKVYAYTVNGPTACVFPVHIGYDGKVSYGQPVNIADLSSAYVAVNSNYIRGVRKVAEFAAFQFHHTERQAPTRRVNDPLQHFYDLLGIPNTASPAEVKKAYRRQARIHHPDTDKSPDATVKMQGINEAYEQIMKRFE